MASGAGGPAHPGARSVVPAYFERRPRADDPRGITRRARMPPAASTRKPAAPYPPFPREEPGQRVRFWAHVLGWLGRSAWMSFQRLPRWLRILIYVWVAIVLNIKDSPGRTNRSSRIRTPGSSKPSQTSTGAAPILRTSPSSARKSPMSSPTTPQAMRGPAPCSQSLLALPRGIRRRENSRMPPRPDLRPALANPSRTGRPGQGFPVLERSERGPGPRSRRPFGLCGLRLGPDARVRGVTIGHRRQGRRRLRRLDSVVSGRDRGRRDNRPGDQCQNTGRGRGRRLGCNSAIAPLSGVVMTGSFLRLYVHEGQRHPCRLLWEWLLIRANQHGIHGGSAFKAMGGLGVIIS